MSRGWRLEKDRVDAAANPAANLLQQGGNPGTEQSALTTSLLHLWPLGRMSAINAQELALMAILDGAQHKELADLASCGNFGLNPGNVHRDLMSRFGADVRIPEAFVIPSYGKTATVPCLDTDMGIFMPCLMVHSLTKYEGEFDAMFGIGKQRHFWDMVEAANDPKLDGHPIKLVPGWKDITIPLYIHGDKVEYAKDSIMAWHFGSLLTISATLDCSFLMGAFPAMSTVPTTDTCVPGLGALHGLGGCIHCRISLQAPSRK